MVKGSQRQLRRINGDILRRSAIVLGILHRKVLGDQGQDVDIALIIPKQNDVFQRGVRPRNIGHTLRRVFYRLDGENVLQVNSTRKKIVKTVFFIKKVCEGQRLCFHLALASSTMECTSKKIISKLTRHLTFHLLIESKKKAKPYTQ